MNAVVSALAFNMEGSMGKTVVPLKGGIVCPWIASLLVGIQGFGLAVLYF